MVDESPAHLWLYERMR